MDRLYSISFPTNILQFFSIRKSGFIAGPLKKKNELYWLSCLTPDTLQLGKADAFNYLKFKLPWRQEHEYRVPRGTFLAHLHSFQLSWPTFQESNVRAVVIACSCLSCTDLNWPVAYPIFQSSGPCWVYEGVKALHSSPVSMDIRSCFTQKGFFPGKWESFTTRVGFGFVYEMGSLLIVDRKLLDVEVKLWK